MKILELRFKNLNSLSGEWFIDFTHPEYISNGIFALTGPTGAGKSTILDAICLALYGATPRLGKITKSDNEIMSRQKGECFAEVMFESQAGRFRCHWAQHRARKKTDGELQHPRHEISEGVHQGKVIEHQLRRVAAVVEEKTGMDFERFTRSMLLAQGEFDTFLKADLEQKSKILEQITGTEIYTEISRRVHERQRDERDKLNLLYAEVSGTTILEPDQEREIQQGLEEEQKQESTIAAKISEAEKSIRWLNGIDGLKKEISSLSEESEKLSSDLESFKPERKRLNQALNAAKLDGEYATFDSVRKQQEADQSALKAEENKLPELEATVGQKAAALEEAEKLTLNAKGELKAAGPLIQKVRSLDQKLTDKFISIQGDDAECEKYASQIKDSKALKSQEQAKRETACKELNLTQEYLEVHSRDEWLVGGLAGIEEQLANLLVAQKDINAKASDELKAIEAIKVASNKMEECSTQLNDRRLKVDSAVKSLEQERKEFALLLGGQLLREYRTEKETLLREMAFLTKIVELEDHRTKLEDGQPCPLCGAMNHPFAEGNTPEPDETEKRIDSLSELIQKAEELELAIKRSESEEKKALKSLADSEKLEAEAANEKKAAEKSITDISLALEKMRSAFMDLKHAVLCKLQPLGIDDIPDSEIPELLCSLQDRLRKWQNQVKKKAEGEKHLSDLDGELKQLDAVIETCSKILAEKQSALEIIRAEYKAGTLERKELFGVKDPDVEESRLNKAISDAEEVEKQTRGRLDEVRQKLHSVKANIESLKIRIEKRVSELRLLEPKLESLFRSIGFSNEKQFLEARLSATERDELNLKAKALDDKQTDLLARQKDREGRLSSETAKNITAATLEELEPAFMEYEQAQKSLRDEIAGLKHKLAENTAAKERVKDKQAFIDAQKIECHRWDRLHSLIGSADGKKYRNFAQGLTFELMVFHANHQLEKMTDRYLLIRDEGQPLSLNVIDNYQAGEIRSTKNLSGGESFIVSLTLALGLSKMASRKVRVDSLFLDEGFGTLDEDTLETALDTLSSLQQDGKLIGVISHVPALKERIGTQIQVTPQSGGKSSISGPGCGIVN